MATELQEKQQAPRMQWIRPNCYYCKQLMYGTRHQAIENERLGQIYIKTTYVCPHCNYWETIKVPRKLADTIVDCAHELTVERDNQDPGITNVLDAEAQEPLSRYPQMRFTCHFCPKTMYIINRHIEDDTRTGQTYVESMHACPHCDYWKTAKVPRKLAETTEDELRQGIK